MSSSLLLSVSPSRNPVSCIDCWRATGCTVALGCWLVAALLASTDASAAFGPFVHGDGIHALGFGGVSMVAAEDSYAIAGNPANAASLGSRYDLGLDWEQFFPYARFRGNLLGADQTSSSRFRHVLIPQGGYVHALDERWSVGITGFGVGFGTDYKRSPFERFGGPQRSGITLLQVGLSQVLAWRPTDDHALGLALNLSYQQAEVEGLDPLKLLSENPQRLSDQNRDGAFGVGYSLGWQAHPTSWLELGLVYRSKTWAQRFDDYAGLLPDGGRLEFPARYGGAIAIRPWQRWTFAVEVQEVLFSNEIATGNPIEKLLDEGKRLGAPDGPGFGWNDQTIVKFGVAWQYTSQWKLRAGYSHGTTILPRDQTLISILAPPTTAEHYTLGASYVHDSGWRVDTYAAYGPRRDVRGNSSVPLVLGGGEVDVGGSTHALGFSFGRSLD